MRRVALAVAALVVVRNTRVCGTRRVGWIRVFGWGVHWKNVRTERMWFSERNGYLCPSLVVGPMWVTWLRRNRDRKGVRR